MVNISTTAEDWVLELRRFSLVAITMAKIFMMVIDSIKVKHCISAKYFQTVMLKNQLVVYTEQIMEL